MTTDLFGSGSNNSENSRSSSFGQGRNGGFEAEDRIRQILRSGEHLLWSGRPDPAKRFTRKDIFLVPFSLFWCGFAIFWTVSTFRSAARVPVFPIFGAFFVAVGVMMVFGRFILKARGRRKTEYFLTDRRAVIARGPGRVEDVSLAGQPVSTAREGRHVTVRFGAGPSDRYAAWENTGMEEIFPSARAFAFYDVSDGDALLAALDRARAAEGPGPRVSEQ